ncbi:YfhO family protein [Thermodesulfobacteriota bacterium]
MQKYFNKKDILIYALLCLFCLYLFKHIIIGGHKLTGTDFVTFYLGMKQFLYNELHMFHSIPFWNPHIFGGMPFWAHFESTIFYPFGFLFWLITPDRAYGYTMFFHLILAGIFMYILARSFSISRAGSFVAATVFSCNGYIMAILYLGQMCPVESYIWLPLIIYFVNQAILSERPYFNAAMAGMFWGIQILAGAPQDAFYTFLASILFLVFSLRCRGISSSRFIKLSVIASLLFVMGAGIASIQLVPAFELIANSVRTSLDSYEMITHGSYPPEGIITAFLPNFFGNYAHGTFWVKNVPWSIPQQNLYVGILPIFLLFFLSYRHPDKKNIILFAGALAVIAFFLALGRHTPIYKLVYLLPGFDRFRAPSKIIVLWVFAIGLLSGKGMDDLFRHKYRYSNNVIIIWMIVITSIVVLDGLFHFNRSFILKVFSPFILDDAIPGKMTFATKIICNEFHRLTLVILSITLIIFLLRHGILKLKIAAAILCVLLLIDLGYVNNGAVQYDDSIYRSVEKIRNDLNISIGKDKDIYRVGSFESGLGPNLEMYLGYQTVGGFTALFPNRYYEYINKYVNGYLLEGWQYFFYGAHDNNILMDLLNVKYAISHNNHEYTFRDTYHPRAFIVYTHKVLPKDEILDYMVSSDFDPRKIVLIEKEEFYSDLQQKHLPNTDALGRTEIMSYRPDHITLKTDSSTPGYLVLSEIFYPGWKAFLDGNPVRIFRGNYLFRVIKLPEGRHVIRMVFDPLPIKVGISITIFTIFMLFNIIIYCFKERIPFLKKH